MDLQLYYDLFSQPSRSLYILLNLAKIDFEKCPIELGKGQHLTKEFADTKSKIQKVPFIHDGNFKLNESVAIIRYLSREYSLDEKLYPKDSKQQAKVDEYLEWHHLNVRLNCSTYFLVKWLTPMKTGKEPTPKELKKITRHMEKSLKDFQRIFLSNGRFIFGDTMSYADIHAACEIEQIRMAGYNPREHFPRLKTWMEDVRAMCNPYYDQAHKIVNEVAASYEEDSEDLLKSKL